MPLAALMAIRYLPGADRAGIPPSVAVPFLLSWKVTPAGRAPDCERVGAGDPDVVTMKVLDTATLRVAEVALVMMGGAPGVTGIEGNEGRDVPAALVAVTVKV